MKSRRFYKTISIICTLLTLLAPGTGWANPKNGRVVSGNAKISEKSSGHLTVHQSSDKAIINWNSFNIDTNEHTQFIQPSSSSITLNRVTGNVSSEINGRLSANGRLVLVNPNGILFGSTARVDVSGLIATTSDISNSDFLAGRLNFSIPGRPDATVVNRGRITVADRGLAAFVAPGVSNTGIIEAKLGRVSLASGNRFTLDLYGDGLVNLAVDDQVLPGLKAADGKKLDAAVSNSGKILADGGRVLLTAGAAENVVNSVVNMSGVIQANSVHSKNGEITLAGGSVNVSGKIEAAGNDTNETGGDVKVLGKNVEISSGASVDVSGYAGGGEILIGGDYQGAGSLTSDATYVGTEVLLNASAFDFGDGGRVIVWSDGWTYYEGLISARGGLNGGNGGFVEVSGKETLSFRGGVDTSAPMGMTGTLLLDPTTINICSGGGCTTGPLSLGALIQDNGANAAISNLHVNDLISALNSSNVTISTASAGAGLGDVNINVGFTWNSGNDLTITADRDINVNRNITGNAGANLTLNAQEDITIANNRTIRLNGSGNLNLNADSDNNGSGDVIMRNSRSRILNYGGDVTLKGANVTTQQILAQASGAGIPNGGDVSITATNGDVTLRQRIYTRGTNVAGSQAGDVTIQASSNVNAATSQAQIRTDSSSNSSANKSGGDVSITAGGNINLQTVNTNTGGANGQAGNVTVTAGGTATTRTINARSTGAAGRGGSVNIQAAGDVTVARSISTYSGTGADGGHVTLKSTGGSVTTNNNATINTRGGMNGNGGNVTVTAAVNANIGTSNGNQTRIDTRGGLNGSNGTGGQVQITAANVNVRRSIDASGGRASGNGGEVTLNATAGAATARNITSRGGTQAGSTGNGGRVRISGTSASARNINTSGGRSSGDGGEVTLNATAGNASVRNVTTGGRMAGSSSDKGRVTITGSTVTLQGNITTAGNAPGKNGGDIQIASNAGLTMNRTLNARGAAGNSSTTTGGNGGNVTLSGDTVSITRDVRTEGGNGGNPNGNGGNGGHITINATGAPSTITLSRNLTTRGGIGRGAGNTGDGGNITSNGDLSINGNRTFNTGSAGGDVTFNGTVNTTGGNRNLTISAGTGTVTFGDDVGTIAGKRIRHLTVTAGETFLNDIQTQANGRVIINGDSKLTEDTTINAHGSGYIRLNGRVDGTGPGGQDLILQANNGTVTLGDEIGGLVRVGDVVTSSIQNTTLNLVNIFTRNGSVLIDMKARVNGSATIDTGLGGGDITFNNLLNGTTAGLDALTLNAGVGDIRFMKNVGLSRRLGDVTVSGANDLTVNARLRAASFNQTSGTGTTDLGSTGGTDITGDVTVRTGDITGLLTGGATDFQVSRTLGGNVNVLSLWIGGKSANMTGIVNGMTGADAAAEVNIVPGSKPGPYIFNGVLLTPPPAPKISKKGPKQSISKVRGNTKTLRRAGSEIPLASVDLIIKSSCQTLTSSDLYTHQAGCVSGGLSIR